MPFNFRLNVQDVFRRLGIQTGARLPQLNDAIQMTMLVTDLSRLVPAPIEPRGLAGVNLDGVIGQFSVLQLQALSPGGIFIENMLFRGDTFPIAENYLIDVTATDLGLPAVATVNVGGTPIFSRFSADTVAVRTGGASLPMTTGREGFTFAPGIFVPNQAFFSVTIRSTNRRLDVALIWRELPSVEEVG